MKILTIILLYASLSFGQNITNNNVYFNVNVFPEKGLVDAHSIIDNGKLYVFAGHDMSWNTEDTWRMDRWEIWSTDNLVDWNKENEILPSKTYIGDKPNCWAGDIISRNGKYYWYFSNRNKDTGVMVSNSPKGPFKDALGKPLLPAGIIGKLHPYDPELYKENGKYTIIFGAGHYYAATLNKDMISLKDKPKPIIVLDHEGKDMWTSDKPCVFKRKNKYYLIWEKKYAMSNKLLGPYNYIGSFLKEGHCNIFKWKGNYYALLENKDISLFYRGVSIKQLQFNQNGTILIPKDDKIHPLNGRSWDFNLSSMGWRSVEGTTFKWNSRKSISGKLNGYSASIESARWLMTDIKKYSTLIIHLKNNTNAVKAKVLIASHNLKGSFWKQNKPVNWSDSVKVDFEISSNDTKFKKYKINLSDSVNLKDVLERIKIYPALNVAKGTWEINKISIE